MFTKNLENGNIHEPKAETALIRVKDSFYR